ncbi:uncharacterized protein [Epargyreus clarus]|uniref:uncharacterized protein n=1 Tax=Epargyreus clarus TaxID=520877 RepID=UPI003C2CF804
MILKVNIVIAILAIGIIIQPITSLNILGIFPYTGKSHFFVFKPYLEELARRGHNLTVISYFPQEQKLQNYHDISLAGKIKVVEDDFPVERNYKTIFIATVFLATSAVKNCEVLLADEKVQHLWKSKAKFDVVVLEQFNSDCALGLAYQLKAPVVGITSHVLLPWHYGRFGIPHNPSYVSYEMLEGGTHPTLYQRVERSIFDIFTSILYKYFIDRPNENILRRYFDDVPSLEELGREIKFMLLYNYFVLTGSTLLPANVIEVAGFHVAKPKPLPDDIRKFIEESEHGVIYISFGSVLKASTLPNESRDAIIKAVSKLPQRVVWKWDATLPGNPKNIYTSRWLPQNDILAHPNVVAFISHCGFLGTTEAVTYGVPIVGIPVHGDQATNAAAVEESGFGVQIAVTDLTEEVLLQKLKTILDPKFREKAKLISKAFLDRPISAMDSAIFWTEFAARYQNFTFRAPSANVPLYQYLCLDVIAILTCIILVLAYVIKYLISFCSSKKQQLGNKRKNKKDYMLMDHQFKIFGDVLMVETPLSARGCFGTYLCRIGREPTARCHHCDNCLNETAQHTLEVCLALSAERSALSSVLGADLSLPFVVRAIVGSDRSWQAVRSFCEAVMLAKEAAERAREAMSAQPIRRKRTGRPTLTHRPLCEHSSRELVSQVSVYQFRLKADGCIPLFNVVMTRSIIAALLLFALTQTNALNVLGIFPYQGKSHFMVFQIYLQELARRGHSVTVISHFPEERPPPNYHDISLAGSSKVIEGNLPIERSYATIFETALYLTTSGRDNCEVLIANKDVQNLIKKKTKFDVVVVEQFNSDCALAVAYKLKAPVIGITSHILMPWHYNRFGIPYNPSYVSFHFLEGGTKPTLYQRLERTFFDFYFKTIYYIVSQRNNQNTLAKYFDDIPPLEDLAREIKILLLYHNFVLTGSRLFPANIIEVGGYHVAQAKPLTGELKKFVDEAEHGVVYISFGTTVKSGSLSKEKTKALLDAMYELPQRFIWKWDDKALTMDKKKFYVSDWLPQVDILGHPKTLAFLSHAGMGGTTEALNFGVPIIAMPIVGDQPANAAAIEESGLGVQISLNQLTKENIVAAFKKVLDPKFRENIKVVTKAWHDRPLSPMDTAIYWTEFVAKYPNLTYRTAAADVPLYQYLNLDVISIISIILLLIILTIKAVLRLCCGAKKTKQPQSKNKKSKKQ